MSDGKFRVLEIDDHNAATVHAFRDKNHFFVFLKDYAWGEEDYEDGIEVFNLNGDARIGDTRWQAFKAPHEVDHT